jgi:hypothetical protein
MICLEPRRVTIWRAACEMSLIIVVGLGATAIGERREERIPFPDGYRQWTHVKSTVVEPESAAFATNGGLHHFYANELAMKGYRDGTFADGSILIDDLLELDRNASGASTEGRRRRVAVMVKDGRRFPDTSGWGFEVFKADSREGTLSSAARAACHTCHVKAESAVFSRYRP